MALPMNADVAAKSLETRISVLEKSLQATASTITLCVGGSKIVITQGEIHIETGGKITLQALSFDLKTTSNASIHCMNNFTMKASGQADVEASGTLTLKGATINEN